MIDWIRSHPKWSVFLGVLVGFIIILLVLGHKPFSLRETFVPDPADSYEEALARIEEIKAEEAELSNLNPDCESIAMVQEEKAENAIVFLHGFTSCPYQFAELGELYFNQGYNVLIPRQPRHGLNDLDGPPLKGLTA